MPAFRPHTTGTTDAAWDAGLNEKRVRGDEDRAYYTKIYGWYDPDGDEGAKSTYKFIHHMVDASGNPGDANEIACSAGIGVLNGGRGGTTIPKADRKPLYDHLAKHLRDAGKEPPDLKSLDEIASAEGVVLVEDYVHDLSYEQLLAMAAAEVWAIWPDWLNASLNRPLTAHVAQDDLLAVSRPGPKTGGIVRIPVLGMISRRQSMWSLLFGGTSVDGLKAALREVSGDPSVGTVLLDIDSPGGTSSGLMELAAEIRSAAGRKHIVALANDLAASAAYWIASQADEVIATPDALVGSVGVYTLHVDQSELLQRFGVKVTPIFAGRYKVEGNSFEPLSDEARQHWQHLVDDTYNHFIADVARGRNVAPSVVRSDYGEGRVLTAKDAKAVGMVDRIATYDETVKRLGGARADAYLPGQIENASNPQSQAGPNTATRLAYLRRQIDLAEKEQK